MQFMYTMYQSTQTMLYTLYRYCCAVPSVFSYMATRYLGQPSDTTFKTVHEDGSFTLTTQEKGRYVKCWFPKVRRGPSKIAEIRDADGRNVSDEIMPFLGPNRDMHDLRYLHVCSEYKNGSHREQIHPMLKHSVNTPLTIHYYSGAMHGIQGVGL